MHYTSQSTKEFTSLVNYLYDTYDEDFHDEVLDYDRRLRSQLGSTRYRSAFFHVLIGSTPDHQVDRFDFEGHNSVINFIINYMQKVSRKQPKESHLRTSQQAMHATHYQCLAFLNRRTSSFNYVSQKNLTYLLP